MSLFSSSRRTLSAPLRFFRYINQPGVEARERFEALSEDEKAERREQSDKLYGFYAMFPSPYPKRKRSR
jgi:hypothetical protein